MDEKPNIKNIPKQPGCYIFRNKHQEIIYIGKSKSLYNRIRQYFFTTDSTKYNKYAELARNVREIETIITDTETNALILECQLIKKHKPRYNSQLKKSNPYPYIRIDVKQTYPAITIAHYVLDDGGKYYGSFYDKDDVFQAIELISSIWHTPLCCKDSFSGSNKPCLNYHIGKCCAPCSGMVDNEIYRQKINEIVKCLNGDFRLAFSKLNREMKLASKELNFEKAARLRDSISGLKRLKKKQKRLYTDMENKDVYLFFRAFNEQCFSLFFIRDGITLNRVDFPNLKEPEEKFIESFIRNNAQGKIAIENGAFITECILAVYASKYFVPISHKSSDLQTVKKLLKAYREFTSDGF